MKRGINTHTTNHKKPYRAPVLEKVTLDRDIILLQTSLGEPPWETSSYNSSSSSSTTESGQEKNNIFPESEDPFGGNMPNYDYER